jgi:hypothetical protein
MPQSNNTYTSYDLMISLAFILYKIAQISGLARSPA